MMNEGQYTGGDYVRNSVLFYEEPGYPEKAPDLGVCQFWASQDR